MNKTWLVAKREYLKVVTRKSFWVSIVILPVFIGLVGYISGYSSMALEDSIKAAPEEAQEIIIVDQAGVVMTEAYQGAIVQGADPEVAKQKVLNEDADVAIIIPENFLKTLNIDIYAVDQGMVKMSRYNAFAESLVKQSVITENVPLAEQSLLAGNFEITSQNFKDGELVEYNLEKYIIPGLAIIAYFILVMMISSYMLMSVAEEKENRMIETILSIIPSRKIIWGKIIGLTGVGFTQLTTLVVLTIGVIFFIKDMLPFELDFSKIIFDPVQILIALFFIITGFLFMASIMVGLGAAMPTYKEAQGFSPVFIIASILPIYFATALVANPGGKLAIITSYTPFTAQLVLLFRNAIGAISWWELLLGAGVMLLYVAVGFWLAFKLFEIGSLETSKKVNLKNIFSKN